MFGRAFHDCISIIRECFVSRILPMLKKKTFGGQVHLRMISVFGCGAPVGWPHSGDHTASLIHLSRTVGIVYVAVGLL